MRAVHRVAFLGAGGIARAHAFALGALPYYYPEGPRGRKLAVASATAESRWAFADRFGFAEALSPEDLWARDDLEALYILTPNEWHAPHLRRALAMEGLERIYLEKPICVTRAEARELEALAADLPAGRTVQVGFQYLQMAPVRRALQLWHAGEVGAPIHFHARYLHSGYLDPAYREERRSRLTAENGAIVDLGPHAISLLVAFLGNALRVVDARQSGSFPDVPPASDLCTTVLLEEEASGAVGTLLASRISAGAGDLLELELRATRGALRISTEQPDVLWLYRRGAPEGWRELYCGSDYAPATTFPGGRFPAGWLRSLIHAHYLFLGGEDPQATVPDLRHGLAVQRALLCIQEHLARARAEDG
jgi:predicted dehydrogenase